MVSRVLISLRHSAGALKHSHRYDWPVTKAVITGYTTASFNTRNASTLRGAPRNAGRFSRSARSTDFLLLASVRAPCRFCALTNSKPAFSPAAPGTRCGARSVSEDSNSGTSKEEAGSSWTNHEYLATAQATLNAIYESTLAAHEQGGDGDAGISGEGFGPDFDAEWDGGVVRIYLGADGGTYVANTQTPNRQIWLSSPVSGPWRYDWDPKSRRWVSTRDGHALLDLLEEELSAFAGRPVVITDPRQNR